MLDLIDRKKLLNEVEHIRDKPPVPDNELMDYMRRFFFDKIVEIIEKAPTELTRGFEEQKE